MSADPRWKILIVEGATQQTPCISLHKCPSDACDVTTFGITAPFGSVFRSCFDLADLPHPAGSLLKENNDGYWHR